MRLFAAIELLIAGGDGGPTIAAPLPKARPWGTAWAIANPRRILSRRIPTNRDPRVWTTPICELSLVTVTIASLIQHKYEEADAASKAITPCGTAASRQWQIADTVKNTSCCGGTAALALSGPIMAADIRAAAFLLPVGVAFSDLVTVPAVVELGISG